VETGESVAHKSVEVIAEERIRRFKYRAIVAAVLAILAAGAGGYIIAKNKFQNNNPVPAGTSLPLENLSAPPISSTSTPNNMFGGPSGSPVSSRDQATATAPSSVPTAKTYKNDSWHIAFTYTSDGEVAARNVSANSISLADGKSGKAYGFIEKYDNIGDVDLDAVEGQLRGSPDISSISRVTFAGLPALEIQTTSGKSIVVINKDSLYYISGALITQPISSSFKFM
jgi:hypothetical protein